MQKRLYFRSTGRTTPVEAIEVSWPALLTASTTVVALATPHWLCTVTSHGRASIASYTLGGTVARADTTISPARPSHWTEKQKRITSRIFSFSLSIYRLATARTHRSTPTQDVPSNSRRIESRAPSPITNILIIRALRGGALLFLLRFQRFSTCSSTTRSRESAQSQSSRATLRRIFWAQF